MGNIEMTADLPTVRDGGHHVVALLTQAFSRLPDRP